MSLEEQTKQNKDSNVTDTVSLQQQTHKAQINHPNESTPQKQDDAEVGTTFATVLPRCFLGFDSNLKK